MPLKYFSVFVFIFCVTTSVFAEGRSRSRQKQEPQVVKKTSAECVSTLWDLVYEARPSVEVPFKDLMYLGYRNGSLIVTDLEKYNLSKPKGKPRKSTIPPELRKRKKRSSPAQFLRGPGENPHSREPIIRVQSFAGFDRIAAFLPSQAASLQEYWLNNQFMLYWSDENKSVDQLKYRSIELQLIRTQGEFEYILEKNPFEFSPPESIYPKIAVVVLKSSSARPAAFSGTPRLVIYDAKTGKRLGHIDFEDFGFELSKIIFSASGRYAVVKVPNHTRTGYYLLLDLEEKEKEKMIIEAKEFLINSLLVTPPELVGLQAKMKELEK